MAKVTLTNVTAVQNQTSLAATINANSAAIAAAVEKTLSRDGTSPNSMGAQLDMNSHKIINLPVATTATEAVRFSQVSALIDGYQEIYDIRDEVETMRDQTMSYAYFGDYLATDISGVSIPTTVTVFKTIGYSVKGSGAGFYVYVDTSASTNPGELVTLNGRRFRLADSTISVEMFGAVGDGSTDDTSAINSALSFASTYSRKVVFTKKTYKIGALVVPNSSLIRTFGCTFTSIGTLTGTSVEFSIGTNCDIDSIVLNTPGTETNTNFMSIGSGSIIDLIKVTSTAQRAASGITTTGQDVTIGRLESVNIDRPLHVDNTGGASASTNFRIGHIKARSYIRAFRVTYSDYGWVGSMDCATRSPTADGSNGQNGVLLMGAKGWVFGHLRLDDAPEHAFRIGGSTEGGSNEDIEILSLSAKRSGGCTFKSNSNVSGEKVYRVKIGSVYGVDVGENPTAGNSELLRLSHCRDFEIGEAYSSLESATYSAYTGLIMQDCQNIRIGSLGGVNFRKAIVSFDAIDNDADPSDVSGLYIDKLTATCAGGTAISVSMDTFNVGEIFIRGMDVSGFTTQLFAWSNGTLNGSFYIEGTVTGAVWPVFTTPPSDDRFRVDIKYLTGYASGQASYIRSSIYARQMTLPTFVSSSVSPSQLYLLHAGSTSGTAHTLGAGIEFSRLGSTRRGAGIALRQTTTDAKQNGLSFFVGNTGSTASDALVEAVRLHHTGAIQIIDGQTAPATEAGWASIYVDTADGDLKIKFGDGTTKTIVVDT